MTHSGRKQVTHAATGFAGGIVWFVVLSVLEGLQEQDVSTAQMSYGALFLATVVSALAVTLLIAGDIRFKLGLLVGIVACMIVGLSEGAYAGTAQGEPLFSMPALFTRGLATPAVWVALGAVTALAYRTSAPTRRTRLASAPEARQPND